MLYITFHVSQCYIENVHKTFIRNRSWPRAISYACVQFIESKVKMLSIRHEIDQIILMKNKPISLVRTNLQTEII